MTPTRSWWAKCCSQVEPVVQATAIDNVIDCREGKSFVIEMPVPHCGVRLYLALTIAHGRDRNGRSG